jgi:sporulation protein YlmC with PRC-barrel domain
MEFISKLLQTDLKKGRESLGKVVDVAFDLETGHLALLVASSGTSDLSKRYALLPFIPGDRLIQFDWEKKLTLQSQPLTAARAEAAELYRDYKQAIYWIDFAKKKMADSKGVFDEKDYALTFYSTLVQRPIVDMDGTPIGKVDDVAIKSANGEILYMVMLSDDSEKRAIPLAAFVGDQRPDSWSIELMAAQIFKFKPFTLKDPPIEVERGWEEYVATRYGRSGLQAKKKVE